MIASAIGAVAHQIINGSIKAEVMGASRKGLYLRLDSNWIIFLTTEKFHGPMTINLTDPINFGEVIQTWDPVEVNRHEILLNRGNIRINIQGIPIWEIPPRPKDILSSLDRKHNILRVIELVQSSAQDYPLVNLIHPQNKPNTENHFYLPFLSLNHTYSQLTQSKTTLQASKLAAEVLNILCASFVGKGRGLTPSGDDFTTGFILSLSRWGDELCPRINLSELKRDFLPLIYQKTNWLAGNLIECAFNGFADERLIIGLDGILTGKYNPHQIMQALTGWGRSSGVDALVGMALAL